MKVKGIERGTDAEGYILWECPFCGKISGQGRWFNDGILESVPGCEHYRESPEGVIFSKEDEKENTNRE